MDQAAPRVHGDSRARVDAELGKKAASWGRSRGSDSHAAPDDAASARRRRCRTSSGYASRTGDRAPRLVTNPKDPEGAYFYYEGFDPHPIGIGLAAGKSPEELGKFLTKATYADARPGGWDPGERLKDNDLDGVEADVLYTTLGFRIFWLKDQGLQEDCFRVYNDWLAEYCSYAPKRMAGLALISLYDPKAGAQELIRC